MTKFILIAFGFLSRCIFDFGVPIICWYAFGWHVGIAMILWYILWSWTGLSLVSIIRKEQAELEKSTDSALVEFFKEIERIEKESKEKKDKE